MAGSGCLPTRRLFRPAGSTPSREKSLEVSDQLGTARDPLIAILGHHAGNNGAEFGINLGLEFTQIWRLDLDDLTEQGKRAIGCKGDLATQSLVKCDSKRVDIGAMIRVLVEALLR